MKKRICPFLVLLMLIQYVPGFPAFASETSVKNIGTEAFYNEIMDREAEFIASCQLPGGAIAMHAKPMEDQPEGGYRVVPYFSNLAAIGLLDKASYAPVVKKYMDWYFKHLNTAETDYNGVNGTIYDYDVKKDGVTEIPARKYDSTDSYPATFISLLRKYAEVTGDTRYLVDHQNLLDSIGGAMLSTFDTGLTYAKPDYRIQYLMDNVEVLKGLADAAWIYEKVIKDADKSRFYLKYRQEVEDAIENVLWDEKTKCYAKYRNDSMTVSDSVLTIFYPDAAAQLFPIWEGLLSPDDPRALAIYNTFCKNFPGWPEMKNAGDYPWAIMAYTAAIMGDKLRVDTYLKTVKEKYIDREHPSKWYNLEAGMTLLAASEMKNATFSEVKLSIDSLKDGQKVSRLPLGISGSSVNAVKIKVSIENKHAKYKAEFGTNTGGDGKWSITVQEILNGEYTVTAIPVDKFGNYCRTVVLKINLDVNSGSGKITDAKLTAGKNTLRRREKTELKLTTYVNNRIKQIDPGRLKVEYMSDIPELVIFDGKGGITLKRLDRAVKSFQVWANVRFENNIVQTNKVKINLSSVPLNIYEAIMDTHAKWIVESQLVNGAFPVSGKPAGGKYAIDPMCANYTAVGLLTRPEYVVEVGKYLDWYLASLNWPDKNGVFGTVYNYFADAAGKNTVSTNTNKTAAALAGSFISLVRQYGDATGDYKKLGRFELDYMIGGNGMLLSLDENGLFRQKPDNSIRNLGENAIALKGLKDGIWLLENAYSDANAGGDLKSSAGDTAVNGFEKMFWDPASNSYGISVNDKGKKNMHVWSDIGQAVTELQVITNGIIAADSTRAKALYKKFNTSFPNWYKLEKTGYSFETAAYASVLMGDRLRYDAFFKSYKQKYIDNSSFKNLDLMKSGNIMLAAEKAGRQQ